MKTFNEFVNESEAMRRLSQLGLIDPIEAARHHLIRISKSTGWPLTDLEFIEFNEDSDEASSYFDVKGPAFEDEYEKTGIDWRVMTVEISADGGVAVYYDASPLRLGNHLTPDEIRWMQSQLMPIFVPYDKITAEDWQGACDDVIDEFGDAD